MVNPENKEVMQNHTQEESRQFLRWHFWFLVVFSAFLIVTFIYYLPLRFLYNAGEAHRDIQGEAMGEHREESQMMNGNHGERGGALYHETADVKEGLNEIGRAHV